MDVVVGGVQPASYPLFFHVGWNSKYLKDTYCQASWIGRCLLVAGLDTTMPVPLGRNYSYQWIYLAS
jgi:hypothetical protein